MHAIVFRITISDQKESDRLLHEEFVPGMSQAEGFVAGYCETVFSDGAIVSAWAHGHAGGSCPGAAHWIW